jgi:hypothetical protein
MGLTAPIAGASEEQDRGVGCKLFGPVESGARGEGGGFVSGVTGDEFAEDVLLHFGPFLMLFSRSANRRQ